MVERLAMVLQRVDNVYDLEWTKGVQYRDVRLREEIEQSRYVFNRTVNLAPGTFAAAHRELFERYYQMTEVLLASALIWPALEQCLKCSHLFNILDASNNIGATERTAYILRVRRLAVGIAHAYIEPKATEPPVELLHS
jgi:glycyl-tRNA synthetase alpha chain